MSFENPEGDKNFPGGDEGGRKKDAGKKKEGKRDKKEKGYIMFDTDDSSEELVNPEELKSPSKMKKGKAFQFSKKGGILPKFKEKEEKKEKEGKKEEKEKKKEEKEGKKHKSKEKKKGKHRDIDSKSTGPVTIEYEKPVFGVPLSTAVDRNRSHDGIQLPALFRECIDYIEEHGLNCEGIYRISGVKSKVQQLKDSYNKGLPVYLEEHEPNIVASLLKQFLRELPEPVLTSAMTPKFEEASIIRNERKRVEQFLKLINDLPVPNRLLLSWMIVHMTHVIERQRENKMTLQNVSIVLSPTMQISHRVLNVLFSHTKQLFRDTQIKRYIPPLKPATSKWSLELPDNPQALEEELTKQESLLNQLHAERSARPEDTEKDEQLWEVQRVVTQLKRKIKLAKKSVERKKERDEFSKKNVVIEDEELRLELQEVPESVKTQEVPDTDNKQKVKDIETKSKVTDSKEKVKDTENKSKVKDIEDKQKVTLKELAGQQPPKKTASSENVSREKTKKAAPPPPTGEKEAEMERNREKLKSKEEVKDNREIEKEGENKVNKKEESETVEEEAVITESKEEQEAVAQTKTETVKEKNQITVTVDVEPNRMADEPKEVDTEDIDSKEKESVDKSEEGVSHDASVVSHDAPEKGTGTSELRDQAAKDHEIMLQEDTADSADEVGKSTEDVQIKEEEFEDEFEHSLEEILERESGDDSDKVDTDQEVNGFSEDKEEVAEEKGEEEEESATPVPSQEATTLEVEEATPELEEADVTVSEETQTEDQATETVSERKVSPTPAKEEITETVPAKISPVPAPTEKISPVPAPVEKVSPVPTPTEKISPVPMPAEKVPPDVKEVEEEAALPPPLLVPIPAPGLTPIKAPEALEAQERKQEGLDVEVVYDEEHQKLVEEEYALRLEGEELLGIKDELEKKIETEKSEIERLHQEITELQYLRQDSDLEDLSSSSDSSYESEDEEDLQEILNQLLKDNEELEKSNAELCQKIHEERMICLGVKVEIGLLQQKQLQSSVGSETFLEKDSLIEFD